MNNKYLSLIVALCTLISSSIMIGFDVKQNNAKDSKIAESNFNRNEEKAAVTKKSISKSNKKDVHIKEKEAVENKEGYDFDIDKKSKYEILMNEYMNSSLDTYENYLYKEENEDAPVFKVSTDVMREEVTLRDKQKLFIIATKLSPYDFAKIREYLYWKDEEEAARRIIALIKEKLDYKDYEKVKSILGRYIYM
ncbi:hypothetical protein GOM49_02465 [Clostridium bovifaecis]|uniref:Uncharacterized protein n=1 Tax=Clostridium bovifaecis TaxID=2184719 RepID=A0A6I6EVH2_9CLOT|nr:hypothetical protein GOM49_02465 [Clostridium bovifaecis]